MNLAKRLAVISDQLSEITCVLLRIAERLDRPDEVILQELQIAMRGTRAKRPRATRKISHATKAALRESMARRRKEKR